MRPDVVFTVIFKKDGNYLASPTVLAQFGSALVLAMAPDEEGRSFTSARMYKARHGIPIDQPHKADDILKRGFFRIR
jgi:hypothetical protein